jgi:hypothetical protein
MVMRLRVPAPWHKRPLKCADVQVSRDYDPFFGVEGGEETGDLSPAVEFCNGTADGVVCALRDECLIFALTNNEKTGVWGGTTPATRKAIRKQWPLRSGKTPRPEWAWMSEADAMAMLTELQRAEIDAELDEYDEEEDEWAA